MTDTSTADELPPQTNGIVDNGLLDDEERARIRPADIDADVREMERRKRVELIMNSKLFREELERIIETQLKDGSGTTGLLQQISDMVGVNKQAGNVFKSSSCVIPINDIRGIESMGYAKGEKILRCKLAAVFRLIDLYGWTQSANTLITARLNQEDEQFLVNPYGMLFHEITASSLIKVDMQGGVLEQGTTNFSVNVSAFSLHAAVHAARPDLRCIIHVHTPSVVAVSALKHGILPLSQESVVIGEASTHSYLGGLLDTDEKDKLARNLGPINKVLLLSNQGALCSGETIEEAFYNSRNTILASEAQLKLLPLGVDNLVLLNDEARKKIYDAAHKAPESSPRPDQPSILEGKVERKWRLGGIEFEALMRMMDNAGFRTGYIYRHPLVKGEPPKPRNDVEVPPAVSSLGYLLEEEELYRQGLWKKLEGGRKGHDRSRWLNSPNVYQKVEILETGTPDPKKITKWVAEASPSHSSTPVKIESALQFVPKGTNPKEFKKKQQEIKDYRRADKISAGPQSHILEGVTWEEARKMQDAAVTQTGDHVVLMGAASKGIIQRGHQHNATVYKSPYAKNPFDCVTDEELEDYKKVIEKKAKGEYDTDYSESEGLSSAQINKRLDSIHLRSPTSVTSETEEESRDEPQILRIETTTAPKPSQPEVVLSDVERSPVEQFLRAERASVNSYKNCEPLTFQMLNHHHMQTCYRTNSHAGLPRGTYVVPNPVHFHVAHITNPARIMRPVIRKIAPPSNNASNCLNLGHFNTNNHDNNRLDRHRRSGVVSLSLRDAHSVALDMSLDTLKLFIYPFARALNFLEPPLLNNQTSQTSYMADSKRRQLGDDHFNVEYTPVYVDAYSNTLHMERSNSFESRILSDMQDNLISANPASASEDDEGRSKLNETVEFNEYDRDDTCEDLAEISPDLADINYGTSSSSSKTYNVDPEIATKDLETVYNLAISIDNDLRVVVDNIQSDGTLYLEDAVIESTPTELQSSEVSSNVFGHRFNDNAVQNRQKGAMLSNDEQKSSEISSSIFGNGSNGNSSNGKTYVVEESNMDPEEYLAKIFELGQSEEEDLEYYVNNGNGEMENHGRQGATTGPEYAREWSEILLRPESSVFNEFSTAKTSEISSGMLGDDSDTNSSNGKPYVVVEPSCGLEKGLTKIDELDQSEDENLDHGNGEIESGDHQYAITGLEYGSQCSEVFLRYESRVNELPTVKTSEISGDGSNSNISNGKAYVVEEPNYGIQEALKITNELDQSEEENLENDVDNGNDETKQTETESNNLKIMTGLEYVNKSQAIGFKNNYFEELSAVKSSEILSSFLGNGSTSNSSNGRTYVVEESNCDPEEVLAKIIELDQSEEKNFENYIGNGIDETMKSEIESDHGQKRATSVEHVNKGIEILSEMISRPKNSAFNEFSTVEYSEHQENHGRKSIQQRLVFQGENEGFVHQLTDLEEKSPVKHYTSFATEDNDSILDKDLPYSEEFIAETFSRDFLKVVDNYESAIGVIKEVRHILRRNTSRSLDEGIEDPSRTMTSESESCVMRNVDERLLRLAEAMKDHLVDQGFEANELIVFPELVSDLHIPKLINKLKKMYDELFPDRLNSEERNELRLSIANCVLNMLSVDKKFVDDSDSSDNILNISDKLFTISEYVSDILDSFFDSLDNEGFSNFSRDLSNHNQYAKSTPDKRESLPVSLLQNEAHNYVDNSVTAFEIQNEAPNYVDNSVTAFKRDSKSSSESLWIAISPVPAKPPLVVRPKRVNINIDDIPLRPPADLVERCSEEAYLQNVSSQANAKLLSPIREEPRANLFDSNISPDFEVGSDEYDVCDCSDDCTVGTSRNASPSSSVDSSSGVNIVVCNQVNFYRAKANSSGYRQTSNIVFSTDVVIEQKPPVESDEENKENCPLNDSGDWMGFQDARF